jgi:CubicO group peptidase (beta-lactamase class C family)
MKKIIPVLIAACLTFIFSSTDTYDVAARNPVQTFQETRQSEGPGGPKKLETFLDEQFTSLMGSYHIPGAACVVVQEGKIIFSKGYGYADLINNIPVNPKTTVFRTAAVSSPFTATAVMQLVEKNKLSIEEDITKYLAGFNIPAGYEGPITLDHLLTHTAGFDNRVSGLAVHNQADLLPLKDYISKYLPQRVMEPGFVFSFSNYDYSLAGYIAELASGVPFAEYMEKNILQPLQMTHSSFVYPTGLEADFATGYSYHGDHYQEYTVDYFNASPALGLFSTAEDLAHFVTSQLNGGKYEGAQILQPDTVQLMQREKFSNYPGFAGMTDGYFEYFPNNQIAWGYFGEWYGYRSGIFLLPEKNLGLIILSNSDAFHLPYAITQQFVDHYYPAESQNPSSFPGSTSAHNSRLEGVYRTNSHSRTTIEKIALLSGEIPDVVVSVNPDGSVSVDGKGRWVETDDLLFTSTEPDSYQIFFQEDGAERIVAMLTDEENQVWDRIGWYETLPFHIGIMIFSFVTFLSVVLILPIRYFQRKKREQLETVNQTAQVALWLAGILAGISLLVAIGIVSTYATHPVQFVYGIPLVWKFLLVPLHLVPVISLSSVAFAVSAWLNRYWSRAMRIYYSLVVITSLLFTWFLFYWNFLGFKY